MKQAMWGGMMQVSMDMMTDEPPLLWSAEEPNLYVLVLSLLDKQKNLIEAESCQVSCAAFLLRA